MTMEAKQEPTIDQMWDALIAKFPDAQMHSSDYDTHWVGRKRLSEIFEEDDITTYYDYSDEGITAWNEEKRIKERAAKDKAIRDAYKMHCAEPSSPEPSGEGFVEQALCLYEEVTGAVDERRAPQVINRLAELLRIEAAWNRGGGK